MTISRYSSTPILGLGSQFGTGRAHVIIREAVRAKSVTFQTINLQGFERLDDLAGKFYGEGRYWWIIAAASEIGWGLQVPPGTVINIPDLEQVTQLLA